jgi:integrase
MGKDLNGKELGRGFSQRPDRRYEARAVINGIKIDLYDMLLPNLKKAFEAEKAKLKEWYLEWFEKCKSPQLKSDVSRRAYDRKIRNTYIRILGDKKIDDIMQINIQDATNELISDENYATRSVREAIGVLRECLDAAVANRIIVSNPANGVKVFDDNTESKERRVLEHWEQDLLLEETENSYYKEPYRILLLTGMRIGEFSGLQWGDIDFSKKKIHISRSLSTAYFDGKKVMELTTPKTGNSYRDIPFFGDCEKLLVDWRNKQNIYKAKLGKRWRANEELGDLVFTTTMGSPITRYNIIHDMKRVENNIRMKENSRAYIEGREPRYFEHIHPHCMRHTFATRCFEKGLDPLVIQSIMGHSNYSTTISYTHILQDKTDEAVKKAGDLLN